MLATGRPEQARIEQAAALALASEIGDRYEQARAHAGLSAALRATGEPGLARHHRQSARELYAELGAPEAPGLGVLDAVSLTAGEMSAW